MKHFLILKKEECMTNLEQPTHKDLVVPADHLEVEIIHILLLDLMVLETLEI